MFEKLKSLFVTVEETTLENNETENSNVEENNSDSQNNQSETPQKDTIKTITSKVDDSILNKLFKAIEDNNQSGFDYLEYRKSLKSLEKLQMEEATKFQSAFATASTMGVTLDKLIESIEFYKKVLLNEETKFLKASKEQYSINVEEKIKEKEKLNNSIKEKSLQIQQLTEEIRKNQTQLEETSKFIETADSKIKETENNFKVSLQEIINQMEGDIAKLKQYIK